MLRLQDVANVSPEKMLHVYNASIVEQKNQSGKSAAVASEGREVATRSFGERRMQRMAEAWERCNRKRVTACLFEKTYGEKGVYGMLFWSQVLKGDRLRLKYENSIFGLLLTRYLHCRLDVRTPSY